MLMKKFPLLEFRARYFAATHKTRFWAPVGNTSLTINAKTHNSEATKPTIAYTLLALPVNTPKS